MLIENGGFLLPTLLLLPPHTFLVQSPQVPLLFSLCRIKFKGLTIHLHTKTSRTIKRKTGLKIFLQPRLCSFSL